MISFSDLRALAGRRSQPEPASGQPASGQPASGKPASSQPARPAEQTPAPSKPSPPEKPAAASGTADNRVAVRFPASAVPSITGLRLSPLGAEAVLLNISTTGLLAQCAVRLQPGGSLTVLVDGTFEPRSIRGRVARTSVAALGAEGRLLYHVGIAFTTPISLDQLELPTADPLPPPVQQATPSAVAPPAAAPKSAPLRNRW